MYDTESRPALERALEICEKQLGPDHPDVASNLNRLAILFHDLGECAKAGPLLMRALAINESRLGPKHPDVARNLNGLASLYGTQGKWAEAKSLRERALAIWEEVFGPKHPGDGIHLLTKQINPVGGSSRRREKVYQTTAKGIITGFRHRLYPQVAGPPPLA